MAPAKSAECAATTLRLSCSPSSVPFARQQLTQWLAGRGGSTETTEDARVVISELVGNAVRHAQPLADGHIRVSWCIEGRVLEIRVTDGGGSTRPQKLDATASALAGRGMAIVETLATTWWSERNRSEATVHARLCLT